MIMCKHEWKVLSEVITKSKYEVAMAAIKDNVTNYKLPWQLCDATRKHIQTFNCINCGKLKRYVEKI